MFWNQVGTIANLVLLVAYGAIATSILWPLARTGQLYRNHLGLSTGAIFVSCAVGHGIHAEHSLRLVLAEGWAHGGLDWHLASWDAITAVVAIVYWRQRQVEGPPPDAGVLFADLRRRQHELEVEANEARLREELAVERERRVGEERLTHLAMHDPLTGLPNRVLFHDRTATALRQAARSGRCTACLFVDLDHFKVVNDSLGHAAGDQVLVQLGERLAAILRPGDTVARMGGDEFCLLLQELDGAEEAARIADRVLAVLDGYVVVDGVQVTTGASVGVAVAGPDEPATSHTLVRDADTALYRAKGRQRGTQVVFDEAIRADAKHRLRIEADLRGALAAGALEVHYQPQWSLAERRTVGVEALVRWPHPELGPLEPAAFLPVAIETGLVVDLGRLVLERAVADLARWRASVPDLDLAVNLSSRQLGRSTFVADVTQVLAANGVPAEALCLELTETDLSGLSRSALTTIDGLRSLGIRLAVDDVGTGQSSLTHLVTLPVDIIKIDKSFVEQVQVPGAKRAVVDALLSLARTIGVGVVAEGAETQEQLDTLQALGGDVIQGFVISEPLDAAGITRLLRPRAATPGW